MSKNFIGPKLNNIWIFFLMSIFVLPTLAAGKDKSHKNESTVVDGIPKNGTNVALALTGYNYTNKYIDQFSADGQGGGNLYVSSPGGGGGGSVCCIPYRIGADAWKTKIRWQDGGCTYHNTVNDDGSLVYEFYPYFREIEVQIDRKIARNPKYFEVHFFPDGHVDVAITEESSAPRLILEKSRGNRQSPLDRCPNDQRPKN